jgi:hypothetical protein
MLAAVRYGIPAALIVVGHVVLLVGPEGANLEGWALFTGAGLSVLLLNVLHRTGVEGDHERTREQDARSYFDRHGRWPDEDEAEEPEPLEQPARERPDSSRYGPPPIEAPAPRLRRPPRRRGD